MKHTDAIAQPSRESDGLLLIFGTFTMVLAAGFLLGFCFAQRRPQRLIVNKEGKLDIETVEQ